MTKEEKATKELIKFLKRYWNSKEKDQLLIEVRLFKENISFYEWIRRTKDWKEEDKKELIKRLEYGGWKKR